MSLPPQEVRPRLGPSIAAAALYCSMLAACFAQHGAIAPEALDRHVGDDTYYFLQIASNVASGQGSCFSPGEPTNGYHPLWLAVLSVLRWSMPVSRDTMALGASILGALLMACAAMQTFLLRRGLEARRATYCAWFCFLNPWIGCHAINGMETGLFMLLLMGTAAHAARSSVRTRDAVVFGSLSGLLMLARTDSIFFTLPMFGWLAFGRARSWRWILLAGGVATLVLTPWLLWCLLRFGTIEQSSSSAIALILHADRHGLAQWWNMTREIFARMASTVGTFPLVRATTYHPEWMHVFEGGFLAAAAAFTCHRVLRPRLHVSLPPWFWGPVLVLSAYYIAWRHYLQVWHLSTAVLLCLLCVGALVSNGGPIIRRVAVGALVVASLWATRNGYFAPQDGGIESVREFAARHRETLRIGNTDAGRFSYFGHDVVVNLDGIVNNTALRHIRAGRLCDYMVDQQFDIVMMTGDRYEFYNRNVGTVASSLMPPLTDGADPAMGHLDCVKREVIGDEELLHMEGWVGTTVCDAASTHPLLAFLDECETPITTFRGSRYERKDVANALGLSQLIFSGFRFSLHEERVPSSARFVRLGVELRDRVLWAPATLPLAR